MVEDNQDPELDEVGYWTEIKIKIIQEYAAAYARILGRQESIKHYAFIDAFAGAGTHVSESSGDEIDGSPMVALNLSPGFSHYHFIELNPSRAERLRQISAGRKDVTVYEEDCNEVLHRDVFSTCRWEDRRRALCIFDPYQLNPNWTVIQEAGLMRSVEIFLNFMIMDANMNVFWQDPSRVRPEQEERMTRFWGDESWKKLRYQEEQGLFGALPPDKASNDAVVQAYVDRLKKLAGFEFVPKPLPMRNRNRSTIYYLIFASHNETGSKIAQSVFNKYRNRGF